MRSRRFTYANVTATLALVVAVGAGGAFAATQLPKNSVGTKQLQNNAVKSAKVKNGSLTAKDLKAGTIPAPTAVRQSKTAALPFSLEQSSILVVPGVVEVLARCVDGGSDTVGFFFTTKNLGPSDLFYVSNISAEDPVTQDTIGSSLSAGASVNTSFSASTVGLAGHHTSIHFLDASGLTVNVSAVTKVPGAKPCQVTVDVLRTP